MEQDQAPSAAARGSGLTEGLGLVVGRVYPATGCAPIGPPPIQALVGAGLPTNAAQRTYTQAELDAAVAAERERLKEAILARAAEWECDDMAEAYGMRLAAELCGPNV